MSVINLEKVEYVTLYTGDNGSAYCTCNCPCCSQKGRDRHYQGTIEQLLEMFRILPNIKQLYLCGNPDITTDTNFCRTAVEEAMNRNIHLCFSTSGVGGEDVLIKLLEGIPTEIVDYISFSFDAVTEKEMSFMKGINYPMEKALNGLEWAINKGYTVKVQPTLWSCNYRQAEEIINFFRGKGVKWFTFHVGSLESGVNLSSHQHLTPEQIEDVHKQVSRAVNRYKDIKVRCPVIYQKYGENDSEKWYCMYPETTKELLVFFTEEGIVATHTPMASFFDENLSFNLSKFVEIDVTQMPKTETCPFTINLSGRDDTCCRYVSKYWNY